MNRPASRDSATGLTAKDVLEIYETGKHRRYNLLFSVNGGAFAIARLITPDPEHAALVLGGLTLPWLAAGMIFFTLVMTTDIHQFGLRMRGHQSDLFGAPGRVVLWLLGALVAGGWLLVGFAGEVRISR